MEETTSTPAGAKLILPGKFPPWWKIPPNKKLSSHRESMANKNNEKKKKFWNIQKFQI